ncbi:MAG: hypothetical protein ABI835_15325 [Chloroflexota bacterium]
MPFTSAWIEPNRIIRTELSGKLSDQEAKEMSDAHATFLDAGTAPIHLIVDVTRLDAIPINLRQNTSMGEYLRHPSLGWTVLVGGSTLVNFMVSVLGQVFHMKQARRDSTPDALAFLAAQDETLQVEK